MNRTLAMLTVAALALGSAGGASTANAQDGTADAAPSFWLGVSLQPLTPAQVLACRQLLTNAANAAGLTCQVY